MIFTKPQIILEILKIQTTERLSASNFWVIDDAALVLHGVLSNSQSIICNCHSDILKFLMRRFPMNMDNGIRCVEYAPEIYFKENTLSDIGESTIIEGIPVESLESLYDKAIKIKNDDLISLIKNKMDSIKKDSDKIENINIDDLYKTSIKNRFDLSLPVYVTISNRDELEKYELGNIYYTPWDDIVKVTSLKAYVGISKHPAMDQLTKKQLDELKSSSSSMYIVLKLERIDRKENN